MPRYFLKFDNEFIKVPDGTEDINVPVPVNTISEPDIGYRRLITPAKSVGERLGTILATSHACTANWEGIAKLQNSARCIKSLILLVFSLFTSGCSVGFY